YGKALQLWEQARDKVDALQQLLQLAARAAQQKLIDGCSGLELAQAQSYCQFLDQRRREGEQVARMARHKASLVFARLMAARQARAVVEKCFDRQKRRHDQERRRHEQGLLDDMMNHRAVLGQIPPAGPEALWN